MSYIIVIITNFNNNNNNFVIFKSQNLFFYLMIDKRFDHIENYNYKFFMDLFYNSGLTQNRKILENIQKFTKKS